MGRIWVIVVAFGVGLGMTACATHARPADGTVAAGTQELGQAPDPQLSAEERVLVQSVLREMLEATAPERPTEEFAPGRLTAQVYVYSPKQYDAAVAILRRCARNRDR